MRSASSFLIASFLVGCIGPTFVVQQYAGEPRSRETIAILRANARDDARLVMLDDADIAAPITEDGRLHIEMLPARHSIVVTRASAPGERYPALLFDAQADHVYRVSFAGADARIYEVDRSKDTLGSDVTLPPPPPNL